eukprot:3579288-Rhodomonas_salina.1
MAQAAEDARSIWNRYDVDRSNALDKYEIRMLLIDLGTNPQEYPRKFAFWIMALTPERVSRTVPPRGSSESWYRWIETTTERSTLKSLSTGGCRP